MADAKKYELYGPELQQAVSKIQFRAELNTDAFGRDIKASYVDLGLVVQIQNSRDQIIYGRRGAGKTHLLLQLEDHAVRENSLLCYMDCRRLASGLFEPATPHAKQAERFFSSLLTKIHSFILEELTRLEIPNEVEKGKAFDHLNRMVNAIGQNSFTEYCHALEDCLKSVNIKRVYLVIDEWIAIPQEVQPFVAGLMKKIFTPTDKVVLKVGAIGFQSAFGIPQQGGGMLGFEVGADIFPDIDLEDYLVYDRDTPEVAEFFAKVLFRHLSTALPLKESSPLDWIVSTFFTNSKAYHELLRACEGVPRDFLMIFWQSYFAAMPSKEKIGVPTIREATHSYFLREKFKNIQGDPALDRFLGAVIEKAIAKKKARAFMVEHRLSNHNLIKRLFDLRLIHLLKRGYSDGKTVGLRYDMFTIDYGTYVDFINTGKAPQIEFAFVKEDDPVAEDEVVPFNDMRKIRYIKLDDAFFAEFAALPIA